MPAWTFVLGLFGLLGIAALAAGIAAPVGNAISAGAVKSHVSRGMAALSRTLEERR